MPIDPNTGVITSDGTDAQINEAVRNRTQYERTVRERTHSERWHDEAMRPLGLLLLALIVLCLVAAGLVKFLSTLPLWLLIVIGVATVVSIAYFVVRIGIRLVRAFARRPIRMSIAAASIVVVGGWSFSHFSTMFSPAVSQRIVQFEPGQLESTVSRMNGDGVTLYQLFAVPHAWSAPVVIPAAFSNVQLRAQPPMLSMSRNGVETPERGYMPKAGDSLRFMSTSNQPIAITLRVFSRTPSESELNSPISLPVLGTNSP